MITLYESGPHKSVLFDDLSNGSMSQANQHGAVSPTPELSHRFIDWIDGLECGLDLMGKAFNVPD
jgi:hypothetical protein